MARAAELIELSTGGMGLPFDDFLLASGGWFEGDGLETETNTRVVEQTVALLITQFQDDNSVPS